jgi:hypothetical protein
MEGIESQAQGNEAKPQGNENPSQGNENPAQENENIDSKYINRLWHNLAPSTSLTLTFAARGN